MEQASASTRINLANRSSTAGTLCRAADNVKDVEDSEPQNSLPNERIVSDRGAHAPSRVAIGALADGILKFYRNYMKLWDVAGEGACAPRNGSRPR